MDWDAKVEGQELPGITGAFGVGVQNEAGQRLIEFCQENAMVTANTLFQQHKRRLYTWTSPDGQYWNQTDFYFSPSNMWVLSISSWTWLAFPWELWFEPLFTCWLPSVCLPAEVSAQSTLNLFSLGLKKVFICLAALGLGWGTWSAHWGHGLALAAACRLRGWAAWAWVVRSMWDLSSRSRGQTRVPCTAQWVLSRWTTREVPGCFDCWFLRALHTFSAHTVRCDSPFFSHYIACLYILLKCFSERKI